LLQPISRKASSIRIRLARVGALIVVAALMAGAALGGAANAEPAHRLSDAQAHVEAARAEEAALAGDIAAQSERIDAVEQEMGGLRAELTVLEGRLRQSRLRLRRLEQELAQKTRELARARQQFRIAERHANERLVEIYTSDGSNSIGVILGAQSLDELIDNLETSSRIAAYDSDIVDQIRLSRARVRRERERTAALRRAQAAETAELAHHTSARRAAYASLVARRDSLSRLRDARRNALASVQVERREWEAQADALQAQSAAVAAVAASAPPPAVSSPAPPPVSSGGGFIWPVRGTLVSPYGQRWGRLHSGIDIAAPAGTPIVASASGTVAYSGSMSGYGLIVVIQHAGGIATAYAHNSSNSVSVGQSVGQGQTIAAVGCTGSCFGNHVHFEVRVGGSPVDPMGYL
jgi:murein DD-endopeptidase MepM/ murein hydrolase activator NlpD